MKNKRMKITRMEVDMNQADLAKAVGVTRQTVGLIESGDCNPTLNLCIAINKALGETLNDLFWGESEWESKICKMKGFWRSAIR